MAQTRSTPYVLAEVREIVALKSSISPWPKGRAAASSRGAAHCPSSTRRSCCAPTARSPFQGEGHRKVWARLRVVDEVRVSRKRILRIMRENQLLSPYRCRKATGEKHTGTIITEATNVMWGTDGTRILT